MKPLPRGCLIDFSVSGKERNMNCFGACGLHALPRVVFHDFGRTSWWWKFQLSFSESDTSVACDLTELTPLVFLLVLTNGLQSTDMKDCQWSDQWFPPVAVPARESVRKMAQNRTHVTKCKKNIQCTACCIVVTVTGNCLFVMAATLAPSSVQSDLDKPTTCLYCIKT